MLRVVRQASRDVSDRQDEGGAAGWAAGMSHLPAHLGNVYQPCIALVLDAAYAAFHRGLTALHSEPSAQSRVIGRIARYRARVHEAVCDREQQVRPWPNRDEHEQLADGVRPLPSADDGDGTVNHAFFQLISTASGSKTRAPVVVLNTRTLSR